MGNLYPPSPPPPPPDQGWENGMFWLLCVFILDLGEGGWGFAVPFYSVQDFLRALPAITHSIMYSNHNAKSGLKRF